ncbi:PTS sugar transporter subunit IIA [Mammaliicoccus vitulinus]|uniref:PTS sugar transporter subunit IIA n=1 Tax=Mammaliicoccus vitulinus TaxID=71237 RepID=UPI000D1EC37E|nr:PTS sugar transporter subunit IIA [Mammaliicoccus vitulinus]PTI37678.1 PTS sugar transporter subunit IIA [Mammaliicoccus vitulinus]PTI71911.1 PTS sugar transporter subunit IIA [Mammaliicoccus vitulinus]
MALVELIDKNTFIFDKSITTKDELFNSLTEILNEKGYLKNKKKFLKDLYKREKIISTGIEDGFGIPHTKTKYINKPIITFAKTSELDDYKALDDTKINTVFLIALPINAHNSHLDLLSELARLLMDSEFRQYIKNAEQPDEIVKILSV